MIPLPLKPKVTEKDANRAVFEIEALWPGYGVTIGNSLRRVLLSSLEGASPTKMKITGAQHEFATLPGIMEDVITIMLNVKQLRFKLFGDEPQRATLSIKGEKEVKGANLEMPSQLSLINKDLHLASLTSKDAHLEMEILVEKGMGYQARESRKNEKTAIGEILLDAFFSPVTRVRFTTENMRVGDKTDFDRLIIEVETDGTITPEEAFYQSAEILTNHFQTISEPFKQEELIEEVAEETTEEKTKNTIEDMGLSSRTMNALIKNGVKTIEGLAKKSSADLSEMDGLGEKAITEIKKAMKKLGLEFKE